jgi:hypothetical protein
MNSIRFGMLAFWQKLHDSVREPEPLALRLISGERAAPSQP